MCAAGFMPDMNPRCSPEDVGQERGSRGPQLRQAGQSGACQAGPGRARQAEQAGHAPGLQSALSLPAAACACRHVILRRGFVGQDDEGKDELQRELTGAMASGPGAGAGTPVCANLRLCCVVGCGLLGGSGWLPGLGNCDCRAARCLYHGQVSKMRRSGQPRTHGLLTQSEPCSSDTQRLLWRS